MSDFLPPSVPPRKDFIAKFVSVGLVSQNGRGRMSFHWERDRRLERKLSALVEREPEFKRFWGKQDEYSLLVYFLQRWQSASSSQEKNQEKPWLGHCIFAYLEAPRYRAARDRFHAYRNFEDPQQSWEYYLAIAGDVTLSPERVLKLLPKYNPATSSLETFWDFELQNIIKEISHKETNEGKYSPWYKLKTASRKKLKDGLVEIVGVSQREVEAYILAREALYRVYSKLDNRWREPTAEDYQAGADYFNHHYAGECPTCHKVDRDWFEKAIATCLQALQPSYKICYFDEEYIGQGLEMSNSNEVTNGDAENPLDNLASQEWEEAIRQDIPAMTKALLGKLEEFSAEQKEILRLRYGMELRGSQIAERVGKNQSTISRGYTRCRKALLKAIAVWAAQKYPAIQLDNINELEEVLLENWLKKYYKS